MKEHIDLTNLENIGKRRDAANKQDSYDNKLCKYKSVNLSVFTFLFILTHK